MTKKRKKLTAIICTVTGICVLAGASIASYATSNGYNMAKNAVKNLLENENYTAETSLKIAIDGNEIGSTSARELYDRNGEVSLNRELSENFIYGSCSENKSYAQDDSYISSIHYNDGETSDRTHVYVGDSYMGRGAFDEFGELTDDDRETNNKIIRFAELLGDTIVGDLKNNFTYVSGDDSSSTYEISLNTIQIPELVNAGLSAMFSTNSIAEDDPASVLGTDPIVESAFLNFTVDNKGRVTDATASITVTGEGHTGTVDLTLKMYDYGTTKPQRVDISTLPNVETHYMGRNGGIESTVTADGVEIDFSEKAVSVTSDGEALDENGNVVGHIEINKNGEGIIVETETVTQ